MTVCCVSSFGYSGTIAHVVLSAPCGTHELAHAPGKTVQFRRQTLRWDSPVRSGSTASSEFSTPVIGRMLSTSASTLVWEHSFTGHDLSFLRCHRVGKVPLLPGTCYIEFVRVVVEAVHGKQLYSLDEVNFKAIMFLDDDAQLFGVPRVRLQLNRNDGSLSITSTRDQGASTSHAEMKLRLRAESTSAEALDVIATQARCPETVTTDTYYAATGNDYHGEFHALRQGWGGGTGGFLSVVSYGHNEASHLYLRACAFLDACSHAQVWWLDHQRKAFYAASVESYHVNSADLTSNRSMWSTADVSGAYRISNRDGDNMVHAQGWSNGYFDPGWLEERRALRHTYQACFSRRFRLITDSPLR